MGLILASWLHLPVRYSPLRDRTTMYGDTCQYAIRMVSACG